MSEPQEAVVGQKRKAPTKPKYYRKPVPSEKKVTFEDEDELETIDDGEPQQPPKKKKKVAKTKKYYQDLCNELTEELKKKCEKLQVLQQKSREERKEMRELKKTIDEQREKHAAIQSDLNGQIQRLMKWGDNLSEFINTANESYEKVCRLYAHICEKK